MQVSDKNRTKIKPNSERNQEKPCVPCRVRSLRKLTLYRRVGPAAAAADATWPTGARIPQIDADGHADDADARDQTDHAAQDDPRQVDAEDGLDVLVRRRTQRTDGLVRPVRAVVHPVTEEIRVDAKLRLVTPEVGAVDLWKRVK